MCKIIVVANPKGGVGKTTISVNLAASLAVSEKKTLLIDMDPTASCTDALGFNHENIKGDIFSLLGFTKSLEKSVHNTSLENLHFIPAYLPTYEAEEKIERLTYNMSLFKNILQNIIEKYDYIIIDSPPYLRGMTSIALATANSVLIPVNGGHFALIALKKILQYIQFVRSKWNQDLEIEGIIFSMHEPGTNTWSITERKLYSSLGKYVLKTRVPKHTIFSESTFFGKPAILYDVRSKGSNAFLRLAQEMIIKNKTCPVIENTKTTATDYYSYVTDNL